MDKSKIVSGVAMAAAAATMFLAGTGVSMADQTNTVQAKCAGSNACKGQGACASNTNSCKGMNACKGQGWEMLSLMECSAKLGRK